MSELFLWDKSHTSYIEELKKNNGNVIGKGFRYSVAFTAGVYRCNYLTGYVWWADLSNSQTPPKTLTRSPTGQRGNGRKARRLMVQGNDNILNWFL